MFVSRIVRWAAAAATMTVAALAAPAAAAPPAEPPVASPHRYDVPLTGEATFAELGTLTFTGQVRIGVPPNPVSPLRVVHTRLENVVGTGTEVSCAARGAAHFRVTPEGTVQFTGTYNLVPPNPIQPGDPAEACWGNRLSVAYTLTFDAEGNVVGQPTATAVSADGVPAP